MNSELVCVYFLPSRTAHAPVQSYTLQYPAPGHPALARRALELLRAKGIPCAADDKRGYDHGTFVPLMLSYPDADIPVVQMSVIRSLDPK